MAQGGCVIDKICMYELKGDWHSLNLTCSKFLHACDFDVSVSIPNI